MNVNLVKVILLKSLAFSKNGVDIQHSDAGSEVMIPEDLIEGLAEAGYVDDSEGKRDVRPAIEGSQGTYNVKPRDNDADGYEDEELHEMLSTMTVKALIDFAKEQGIAIPDTAARKSDYVTLLYTKLREADYKVPDQE